MTKRHDAPISDQPPVQTGPEALVREQQRESGERSGLPTTPTLSPSQSKGLVRGAAIGLVVGAIVFLPLGLLPLGSAAIGARLVIAAIVGAVAGAVAGAVYQGSRQPQIDLDDPRLHQPDDHRPDGA